jgi:hypothetical protein
MDQVTRDRYACLNVFWYQMPILIDRFWRKRVGVEPTFEAREGLERQL